MSFKVSKNWSGDIAFFHILIQKICFVLTEVCAFLPEFISIMSFKILFCLVSKEKKKYSLFVLLEFIIFTRISLFVFWGRHEFIKSIKEIVK